MKHLVASLLCIALLVLMVGIFGAILGGTFRDFISGRPFDPATVTAMFSPLVYRKVLIASIVAMAFAVLDIQALFSRADDPTSYVLPRSVPLGFAALRARRYLLPVMVMLYLGLFFRLIEGTWGGTGRFATDYDAYIFAALFAPARRPLNTTVADGFNYITKGIGEFLEGLGKGSH